MQSKLPTPQSAALPQRKSRSNMQVASGLIVTFMAATFVLLAMQAEPITATLGFIWAGLLMLALTIQFSRRRK